MGLIGIPSQGVSLFLVDISQVLWLSSGWLALAAVEVEGHRKGGHAS